MDRLTIILSATLLITILLTDIVIGDASNVDPLENSKRGRSIWMGPRLGRRKRNPDESYRTPTMESSQLQALMEMIQESPCAVVAINDAKRHTGNLYIPRLGRESGEEVMTSPDRWIQESDLAGELMSQRSPPFAPRLGRTLPFAPRLGRENDRS